MKTLNYTEHVRVFEVKYHGATNNLPSRVSIYDTRNKVRKYLSYNHEFNNIMDIAEDYLIKQGFILDSFCSLNEKVDLIMTKDFTRELK
jgi:hypothetical protein